MTTAARRTRAASRAARQRGAPGARSGRVTEDIPSPSAPDPVPLTRAGMPGRRRGPRYDPRPMRVTVTGGAGFIGANLCRRLLADPAVDEVVVIDDLSTGSRANLDG